MKEFPGGLNESEMKERVDVLESLNLTKAIRETAIEISEAVKLLQSGTLSEEDQLNLEIKIDDLFKKGEEQSLQRARIMAEHGFPLGSRPNLEKIE